MDDLTREKYLKAGKVASLARELGRELVVEGALFREVADSIEFKIEQQGGKVAFPVNIAVDNVAAHYTPHSADTQVFKKGMLAKIDVGAHVDGYIADTTFTKEVGTNHWGELIRAAEEALEAAIDVTKPGIRAKMIGGAVERTIESYGFNPITNLTGHSLKRYNITVFGGLAGVYLVDIDDDMSLIQNNFAIAGRMGIGWQASQLIQLKLQIDAQTPLYDSDVKEMGDPALQLVMGGSLTFTDNAYLDISIAEDINTTTAADVAFQLALVITY